MISVWLFCDSQYVFPSTQMDESAHSCNSNELIILEYHIEVLVKIDSALLSKKKKQKKRTNQTLQAINVINLTVERTTKFI